MWFHVECLGEPKGKRKAGGPLGKQLMELPIVRGWMSDPPEDWMTVGSNRLIEKVKSCYKKGTSQDWGGILGEEFITFSTTTSSLLYSYPCPLCDNLV